MKYTNFVMVNFLTITIGSIYLTIIKAADREFSPAQSCGANDYLDITNYQCYSCSRPPNAPAGDDSKTGLSARIQNPADPYTCKCSSGWIQYGPDFTTMEPCNNPFALSNFWCDDFQCKQCPQASSLDTTTCMSCSGVGISFDQNTGRCVCDDSDYVLREADALGALLSTGKVCEQCPTGSIVRAKYLEALRQDTSISAIVPKTTEKDYYICEYCPHSAMTFNSAGRCQCSPAGSSNPTWTTVGVEGYKEGQTCVLTSETTFANSNNDYAEIIYSHVEVPFVANSDVAFESSRDVNLANEYQTFTIKQSIVFEHYFMKAATQCRYLRSAEGMEACQTLANLCVLLMYDNDSPACELYAEIHSRRDAWTQVSWDMKMMTPWLYYQDSAQTVTKDLSIQMRMSFNMNDKAGTYDRMRYVFARYALNGTFLGWSPVTTQFEFCTPTFNKIPQWLQFGYGTSTTYTCNLLNIIDQFPEPEFYDMYLVDYANSAEEQEQGGSHSPDGLEGASLYPVPVKIRNLVQNGQFPNDNEFSQETADDIFTRRFFLYDQVTSRETVGGEAQLVRYAKDIKLTTYIREQNPEYIYPPVVEIFYNERLISDVQAQGKDANGAPLDEASTSDLKFTVEYSQDYESFWSSATALFIFAVTLFVLVLLLRLYNWNRRNSRLAGDSNASIDCHFMVRAFAVLFATFAQVMFWFLFFYAEYFFVFFKLQDNVHLLLPVDRPEYGTDNDYYPFEMLLKLCFAGQMFRMADVLWRQTSCDIFFLDWEKPRGRVPSKRGDGTRVKFAPISVWRTIFMANEWNELQVCRKYSLELSLFLLGAILIAGDYQYLATLAPNSSDLSPGPLNMLLRFANTSFWFLLITYSQVGLNWLVINRCISEPPTHWFVDLCTMAKVSVFILDEDYHGYYLHCRSQHEYADGSMLEISRQLRQEEEGLTTDRGLPGTDAGLQTFEIYVSGEWKRQYDHIFRTMVSQEIKGAQADATNFILRVFRRKGGKPAAEKLLRASRKLNAFLRSFIDQTTSEFPMEHRDQTFIHRFLHLPPEMMSTKATVFYPDNQYSFESVLFYGETWNLALFNLLCIALFDYWWDNTMLSLFLTYGADFILKYIRQAFGNANLAAKTLVDDRFLI